jgi:hypothetical protein
MVKAKARATTVKIDAKPRRKNLSRTQIRHGHGFINHGLQLSDETQLTKARREYAYVAA